MAKDEPRRHHFIPRMFIKRFTDTDGKLWLAERKDEGNTVVDGQKRSPDGVFWRPRYYTQISDKGDRDWSVEEAFSRNIETPADEVLDKLVSRARKGASPDLSPAERRTLDEFVYFLWKRTPDRVRQSPVYGNFDESLDETLAELVKLHGDKFAPADRAKFQEAPTRKRMRENVRVQAQSMAAEFVLDAFRTMGIGLCFQTRPNKSFVLAGNPVAKLTTPLEKTLGQPAVEVWVPISSDVALVYVGDRNFSRTIAVPGDDTTRRINGLLWRQSTQMVSRSSTLLTSLASPR